jgi:hypothetical protein
VIVVKTLGAPLKRSESGRRSLGRRRQARPTTEETAPEPVAITRVTVIRGPALEDEQAAREWFERCRDEGAGSEVGEALQLLNRAIHAHRVAAADPHAADVSRARARRVRVGFGSGEELVEGRWRDACEAAPDATGRGRRRMLAPQDQLARILGGRRSTYPSEDLLLRARLDLEQGRTSEAALQAAAAHTALAAELARDEGASPGAQGEPLARLAATAAERALDEGQVEQLEQIVSELERVVRRRRHADGHESS